MILLLVQSALFLAVVGLLIGALIVDRSGVHGRDYLVFDRHHLAYLNAIEKVGCAYCSYANGLAAFFREVAARTEVCWCPIKHARRVLGPHPHYQGFADFGDADA